MPQEQYLAIEDMTRRYRKSIRTIEGWPGKFGFPKYHHKAFGKRWWSLEELRAFEAMFSDRLGARDN
jgi:hypothetical protein